MRYIASLLLVLVYVVYGVCIAPPPISASNAWRTLDENTYWLQMQQTNAILKSVIAGSSPDAAAQQIDVLWRNVDEVQLQDGTLIQIDTAWLWASTPLTLNTAVTLQARVQALLDYQAAHGGLPSGMLSNLDDVLDDDRFDYGVKHKPRETAPVQRDTPDVRPSSGLSRTILIIVAVLVAIGALVYVLRSLNIQPAKVTETAEDIPATSKAADQRAAESRASADYRAAIRYLYLSSLLSLHERGIIHFDPALTNVEHLQQVMQRPPVYDLLRWVVNVFDRVWYGFVPVDETMVDQFRDHVEQLKLLS